MDALRQYFRNITEAVSTIVTGMSVSLRHVGRGDVTLQYPEQRDVLPPRSRMSLFMNADECIACNQCARACPVNCIHIESGKREKGEAVPITIVEEKKKALKLGAFVIDMSQCCYCALCVDPCPTHCLFMTPEFEFSVTNNTPEELTVLSDGETWESADHRRTRVRTQTQHPKFGRQGLVYDFIAITDDLHRRGEHSPVNPLFVEEYQQILDGPIPDPDADDPYSNRQPAEVVEDTTADPGEADKE
jgi:NADH-quinone oxidoreductase subunit I